MKYARPALVCALITGLTLPALATSATAEASTTSGVTIDSTGQDGLGVNVSESRTSPGYTVNVTTSDSTVGFQAYANGVGQGSKVFVTPPTSASQFAVGSYPLATFATDTAARVSRNGANCNSAQGSLEVKEVSYANGTLNQFAATWSLRCDGAAQYAFGEIRYLSSLGITSTTGPRTVTLGSAAVGSPTAGSTITLRNDGTVPATFGTATIVGAEAADFSVSNDLCSGQVVQPSGSCTLSVLSTPSAAGNRSAVLQVPDGSARGVRPVTLYSTGLTAPGMPTSVSAETATNGIRVSWTAPTSSGYDNPTSYEVLRGTSSADLAPLGTSITTTYADALGDSTAAGTTYVYAVKAVNDAGASTPSATATGTTPAAPFVPTSTKAITLDGAPGGGFADTSVTKAAGATVTLSGGTHGLGVSGSDIGSSLGIELGPVLGRNLGVGTFPVQATADDSHGRLAVNAGRYCPVSAGTVRLHQVEQNLSGAVVALDADITFTCGSAIGQDRIEVRFGVDRPYTAVSVPAVDAGPVPVGDTRDVAAVYTNTGTAPVTISAVALTSPTGGAPVDWSLRSDNTCSGATLAAGASCHTALQVAASTPGPRPARITFTDNTPAGLHVRSLTAHGTMVPAAPTNLIPSRSAGQVHLSWHDTGDSNQQATSFVISRGPDADHLVPLGTADAEGFKTFTDPDTADGVRVYGIRGVNVAGAGPIATITVDAALRAPTASGAAAVKTVALTWTVPTGLAPDGIVSYRVFRGSSPTTLTTVQDVVGTRFTAAAPASGAHVYYAVSALSGSTVGPRSAVVDLVGTTTQLVTASIVAGSSSPLRLHSPRGEYVSDLPETDTSQPLRAEVAASPNGTKIAYVQVNFGGPLPVYSVWVWNTDGSGTPLRLASGTQPKSGVSWSPDGKNIAYWLEDRIMIAPAAGGGSVAVAGSVGLSEPSWLDDRTLVAQDDSSLTAPLVTLAASGTGAGTRMALLTTSGGYAPSVDPRGQQIAYLHPDENGDALRILTVAGGAVRAASAPASTWLSRPSWTRDSSRLYFTGANAAGSDIYSVASAGGDYSRYMTSQYELSVSVSAPDTVAPSGVRLGGIPAVTLGGSVTPTFAATDALNDVTSYRVNYRRIGYSGGWSATTSVAPKAIAVAPGYTYCFTVQATDRVGNTSAATAQQCTVVPLDDRSFARSSLVTPISNAAYYARTAMKATSRGQTLTRPGVTARQLYLVASSCPTCGTVDVLLGTTRVASFNLTGTAANKRVYTIPAFAAARAGTVVIKVTSTGKPVVIDGVGIRRT